MSRLGDLIVRLKMRYEDYQQGLSKAKADTSSFGSSIKKNWTAVVGRITAVTASIYGTVKAMEALAHTNQTLGDKWDMMVAGMKEGWEVLKNAIATTDFSNLFSRIEEAAKAAAGLQAAKDAEFEAQNGAELIEARNRSRAIQLDETAKNIGLDNATRVAAIDNLAKLYHESADILLSAYDETAKRAVDIFLVRVKDLKTADITEDMRKQVIDFLVWMSKKGEDFSVAERVVQAQGALKSLNVAIALAEANSDYSAKELRRQYAETEKQISSLKKEYSALGGSVEYLNMLYGYNNNINDKVTQQLKDYQVRAETQKTAVDEQTKKFRNLKNSLLAVSDAARLAYESMDELTKERFLEQTSDNYNGPVSPDIKKIIDALNNKDKGGKNTGKTAYDLFVDNLNARKAKYERYAKWKDSTDEKLKKSAAELYEELKQEGGSYLQYLYKQRDALSDGNSLTAERRKELALVNDEIASLSSSKAMDDINRNFLANLSKSNKELSMLVDTIKEEIIEIGDLSLADLPDPSGMFRNFAEYTAWLERIGMTAENLNEALNDSIVRGFSNSMQVLMDGLTGVQELDGGAVLKALLDPLADVVVQAGEMIMLQGLGVEAFKSSLIAGNGFAAIAAGAAMIAIGTAAKAGLSSLAGSYVGRVAGSAGSAAYGDAGVQAYSGELTIYVKGTLKGSDIVLSGNKTIKDWGR